MFEDLTHSPTYTNLSLILPNAIHCLFEIYRIELKQCKTNNNQKHENKCEQQSTHEHYQSRWMKND
jgi:hypothetical protein